MVSRTQAILAACAAALVVACGGGGGGRGEGGDIGKSPPPAGPSDPNGPGSTSPEPVLFFEQTEDGTYALYAVKPDGSEKRLIDSGSKGPQSNARISGNQVVFTHVVSVDTNGFTTASQAMVAMLDGSGSRAITEADAVYNLAAVVGDRVVLSRKANGAELNVDLMSVRLDGADPRGLATDATLVEKFEAAVQGHIVFRTQPLIGGDIKLYAVVADGSANAVPIAATGNSEVLSRIVGDRIVFSEGVPTGIGSAQFNLYSRRWSDGEDLKILADSLESESVLGVMGERLFITVGPAGTEQKRIDAINVDGTERATSLVSDAQFAAYSDGKVYFERAVEKVAQVFMADVVTPGTPTQLTSAPVDSNLLAIFGNTLVLSREMPRTSGSLTQLDLFSLDLLQPSGNATPLVPTPDRHTRLHGFSKGRILFIEASVVGGGEQTLQSVLPDGTGSVRLPPETQSDEILAKVGADGRILIRALSSTTPQAVTLSLADADGGKALNLTPAVRDAGFVNLK